MNKIRCITILIYCCVAIHGISAQSFYQVAPLPFNTSYSDEAAAVPYENGILYCSDRRANMLTSRVDLDDRSLFRLYFVPKKDSTRWGTPHALPKELAPNAHQGPCSVSADGNELYFTVNDKDVNGIFIAQKAGEGWTNIRPFTLNRTNYRNAHPSLSRDGKRLFFASDMPGGYGGFDIYYCEWTPRGWGAPKNPGPEVNTAEDELYPFIQGNGVLYFSSKAHGSMGGLDIFSVREVNGEWGFRQQPEAPVNSEYDDFAYAAIDADGMEGYFSSDRDGKSVNIFSFESLFPIFSECNPQEENNYTFELFEETSVNLDTTSFRYEWDCGDGTVKKGQTVMHTYASTGQYIAILNVVDTLTGEKTKQATTAMVNALDVEQPFITGNDTVEAGKPLALDASKTYLPDLDIEGYYWIFDDGTKLQGESTEHVFASPGIRRVQLGVIGKHKYTGEKVKVCSYRDFTVTQ